MKLYFSISAFISSIIAIYNITYALGMEDIPCDEKEARMFQQIAALDSGAEDAPEKSEETGGKAFDTKKFGRESRRFVEKAEEELKLTKEKARKDRERARKKRQKDRKRQEAAAAKESGRLSKEAAMLAVAEKAKNEAAARKIKATNASMKRVDERLFPTASDEMRIDTDASLALHRKLRAMGASRQRKMAVAAAASAASDVQYIDIPRSTFASMESAAPVAMMIKALTDQGYTASMQNNPDGRTARLTLTRLSGEEHRALMVSNIFETTSGKEVAALSRGFDCTDHLDGSVTIIGAEKLEGPKALTSGEKDKTLPKERVLVAFQ